MLVIAFLLSYTEQERYAVRYGSGKQSLVNSFPLLFAFYGALDTDGEEVGTERTFASLIREKDVGQTVTLEVTRGSETVTVSVTLEEAPN
ncbi:MAG: PDZ domain-containing protein [Candidatus Paceibacterota bacterium]